MKNDSSEPLVYLWFTLDESIEKRLPRTYIYIYDNLVGFRNIVPEQVYHRHFPTTTVDPVAVKAEQGLTQRKCD